MALTYTPVPPEDLDELDALLGPALNFPPGDMRKFMTEMVGLANMRAVWQSGRIVAGLGGIPFEQWFGGRRVACCGVTAVGVAPDVRGAGVGALMLREHLAELYQAGTPLACLYPATLSYYRGAGYERAGQRITYELPLGLIEVRDAESVELLPFGPEEFATARHLYEQRCQRTSGHLQRPDWMWWNKLEPNDRQLFRFLALQNGQPQGYISYSVGVRKEPLIILDLVALTPAVSKRFLQLLAGYRSVVEMAVWTGGPSDVLVQGLAENLSAGAKQRVGIRNSYDWMLRLVDVVAAFEARGYRSGLAGQVELDISDPLLPHNTGRFILEIADHQARMYPGGSGTIQCDIRALAVLYTGFLAAEELQAIGTLHGPATELSRLAGLLSGPPPWMPDVF